MQTTVKKSVGDAVRHTLKYGNSVNGMLVVSPKSDRLGIAAT